MSKWQRFTSKIIKNEFFVSVDTHDINRAYWIDKTPRYVCLGVKWQYTHSSKTGPRYLEVVLFNNVFKYTKPQYNPTLKSIPYFIDDINLPNVTVKRIQK